jgi:glycosyltransferase involved in cell wall biosynthesis
MSAPEISIIIPVYNEEGILHSAVVDLRERLAPFGWNYEIILAENGSRDRTVDIASELEAKYPEIRHISVGEPNYGKALRLGILAARGELVLADEIDLCDTDFHRRAVDLLRAGSADLVIGSKLIGGAKDERPFFRHAASLLYTGMLRLLLGFRRNLLLPVAEACLVEKDVFASEFVIRAYRDALRVIEIPTRLMEKRPPTINLMKRVPNVLRSIAKLTWAIRVRG